MLRRGGLMAAMLVLAVSGCGQTTLPSHVARMSPDALVTGSFRLYGGGLHPPPSGGVWIDGFAHWTATETGKVFTARGDAQGRYSISLPPGTYQAVVWGGHNFQQGDCGPPFSATRQFVLRSGEHIVVNFGCGALR